MERAAESHISTPLASPLLESALLFNFIIHAVAMLGMVTLLMRTLPGGGTADDAARIAFIAHHPWLFRLGWFPWQVTAAADVWLGWALLRTPWIPRGPALISLLITLAAVVPDQTGQLLWITRGVHLAQQALDTNQTSKYLAFETPIFKMVAGYGAMGYLIGAIGWTWCFAAAGIWSRRLAWLTLVTWSIFAIAVALFFLPPAWKPNPALIGAFNAAGFVFLQWWLVAISERVLLRSRPVAERGCHAPWRLPDRGILNWLCELIGNSRFARLIGEYLPAPVLVSDIRDVVYLNYIVDAKRLMPLVPSTLALQRLGDGGRSAIFTVLIYRHGQFGARWLGPLRRFMPSPIQSNWRIYVTNPRTGAQGVCFTDSVIERIPHALAARLLTEGVPMHVPAKASLQRGDDDLFRMLLEPGGGTAPSLRAELRLTGSRELPDEWRACFENYEEMLAYLIPQNRAFAGQPWRGRIVRQEIDLPIPLSSVNPMAGAVESPAIQMIAGDAVPLCFHVPAVAFRFNEECSEAMVA